MKRPRNLLFYLGAATLLAIFALAAGTLAGAEFALPIAILAVLVLGFFAANDLLSRNVMRRHGGDPRAAVADADEGLPSAHAIPDDGTALGDTAEAHAEINPHDLPMDSPNRRAVERQAAQRGGTTRGNREGAAGGAVLEQEDAPPSRREGYEEEDPSTSSRAR